MMGWMETLSSWWVNIRRKGDNVQMRCENIQKSPKDQRVYRGLVLHNGLKVLLINDPNTDKAAIALDVHVGHTSDPEKWPGLAHLCEHMLFMGTQKNVTADHFKNFLNEHGGSSNAYTSLDHTNYYLDILPHYLKEAISRFSVLVRNPSYSPTIVERELRVVNAEHEKNRMNDQWRLFQIGKSTANPHHPYSKFGTGNSDSLNPEEKGGFNSLSQELRKFHETYYAANSMCIVIVGKEELDILEEMTVKPLSRLRSNRKELFPAEISPYGLNELKVQIQMVPIKDMQNMLLTWSIDDINPLYRIKPAHYIGYCIGHQGEGSLFTELKKKGWVNSMAAAPKPGGKGYTFFCISMDLTDSGFENTDAIINLVFQYLNLLKSHGVHERVYRECAEIKQLRFQFKDKELARDYASDCADLLQVLPFEDVLTGPWLMWDFQPHVISNILSHFCPDNLRVIIRSTKFKNETNHIERWYGTEYSIHAIPSVTIEAWTDAGLNSIFYLPAKNEFIPQRLTLTESYKQVSKYPVVVMETPQLKLWHKQDDTFLLPKTFITLLIASQIGIESGKQQVLCDLLISMIKGQADEALGVMPLSNYNSLLHEDPLNEVRGDMMVHVLNDHLEPILYPAQLAGSICDVFLSSRGLIITIQGFSDTVGILLTNILDWVLNFQVNETRFLSIKEKYMKMLSNFDHEPPFKQAKYFSNCILSPKCWSRATLLDKVKGVDVVELNSFMCELFSSFHVEVLVYGDVSINRAKSYGENIKLMALKKCSVSFEDKNEIHLQETQLSPGTFHYYMHEASSVSSANANSILLYWQCGRETSGMNAVTELFVQLIHQHLYDVMRTQKQMGYLLQCGVRGVRLVRGVRILIQSHYPSSVLFENILDFVNGLQKFLETMSSAMFENHRGALKIQKLDEPKRMMDQSALYWREIASTQYQFDRQINEADVLDNITPADVLRFYEEHILPSSSLCRLICVNVHVGCKDDTQECLQIPNGGSLQNMTDPLSSVKNISYIDNIDNFEIGGKVW